MRRRVEVHRRQPLLVIPGHRAADELVGVLMAPVLRRRHSLQLDVAEHRFDRGFVADVGCARRAVQTGEQGGVDVDDILVAFVKPLIASQQVLVAGVRDGKPAAWLFVNAGACPG